MSSSNTSFHFSDLRGVHIFVLDGGFESRPIFDLDPVGDVQRISLSPGQFHDEIFDFGPFFRDAEQALGVDAPSGSYLLGLSFEGSPKGYSTEDFEQLFR